MMFVSIIQIDWDDDRRRCLGPELLIPLTDLVFIEPDIATDTPPSNEPLHYIRFKLQGYNDHIDVNYGFITQKVFDLLLTRVIR